MLQNTQFDYKAIVRYSDAYYATETQKKSIKFEEIKMLLQIFDSNKDFNVLFKSPLLNKKQQSLLVFKIFSDKESKKISVSKNLLGLISLLAKNSKLHILEDVLKRCLELKNFNNKELKVHVTSVSKLNESLVDRLKKIFSKNGKMNVKVINYIDKNLLGGLVIKVGSNLIDTSVRTKLNKVKSAMKGVN